MKRNIAFAVAITVLATLGACRTPAPKEIGSKYYDNFYADTAIEAVSDGEAYSFDGRVK